MADKLAGREREHWVDNVFFYAYYRDRKWGWYDKDDGDDDEEYNGEITDSL